MLYIQVGVGDGEILNFCVQLLEALDAFIVVERDGSIIACAALFPFFDEICGEVAAFVVSPECRGHGQGDKLLGTCDVNLLPTSFTLSLSSTHLARH